MKYDSSIHHRWSIRLKGYDYSQAGAYFVTICVWNKECLFGEVTDGAVQLNEYGHVVQNEWKKTTELRRNVELDYHVVMPNHFHGIVLIDDYGCRGTARRALGIDYGKGTARCTPTKTTE